MSTHDHSNLHSKDPLVVSRLIPASPEVVFAAWTDPTHLLQWWGPQGVRLSAAEIDLRVGGCYRLANTFGDGTTLWITGAFEVVDPPNRLVYTWAHEPIDETTETTRVAVHFDANSGGTQVTVTHTGFRSRRSRRDHEIGWVQCLDGLDRLFVTN